MIQHFFIEKLKGKQNQIFETLRTEELNFLWRVIIHGKEYLGLSEVGGLVSHLRELSV